MNKLTSEVPVRVYPYEFDLVDGTTRIFNLTELEFEQIQKIMEEMAQLPSEGPPVRQPGERNMYELSNELAYKAKV